MANRKDLSDWLIHFVHDRNGKNEAPPWDPCESVQCRYPVAFDDAGEPLFTHWPEHDEFYDFPHDASALSVLRKILNDGHIRSGWSFRRGKPTIYGRQSAVCFTEMPLYALVDYAKSRADEQNVSTCGIALRKTELFQHGARPVIYGLSRPHAESSARRPWWPAPRILDASCGIGLHEQYRYVAMNLGGSRRIDWSHEREWRWTTDFVDGEGTPGLPIWSEDNLGFSEVILIVQTEKDAKQVLDRLKMYHDNPLNAFSFEIDRKSLDHTKVLSLDTITDSFRSDPSTRLEDVPALSLKKFKQPKPSEYVLEHVRKVVARARIAAKKAAEGPDGGLFGFAWVVTYDAQSEVTQALLDLKYATVNEGRSYIVDAVMKDVHSSMIDTVEAAANAAAEVLKTELNQPFYCISMMD